MSAEDDRHRCVGLAAAMALHNLDGDQAAQQAVWEGAVADGLEGGLVTALAALTNAYGEKAAGGRDQLRAGLAAMAVRNAR
jgi:hypothetical protein